ncbi:MAG: putative hydrolase of the superfamily [Alphaproteobacteria bacterium]|nr:putative hydrolase of the superfamily [Alphaproteobacteria bacterium]
MKIFFDVDGVVIDGWHAKPERRKRWDTTIEQDLGIDLEAFQQKFFASPAGKFPSVMHGCIAGEYDLKEALTALLPTVGYDGSVDVFVRYWCEKDSNVNRGVLEAVKHLAEHPHVELYLLTGQEHYRAAYLWKELKFREYFNDILYSAKLGHLKNTREFFDHVNSTLGITALERPLFFDDQEEVVCLARKAGWDACIFNTVEDVRTHPRLRSLLDDLGDHHT